MIFELMMLVFAFGFSYAVIFAITPLAVKFGLVDTPCNRKQHDGSIPLIGGLSIFLAVFISVIAFYPLTTQVISYLVCAGAIVILGVVDDYRQLGVKIRLCIQVVVALVMIMGSDVYIQNLGDLFSFGDVNLSWLGIIFTIISVRPCITHVHLI
ncbi:undecaprenyl-phosphate alpha-N-acetylglucosaminyl 1-phosphate transferase, partial [Pseudoalteromonas sp. SG41-6]|nr:undecaprenyl-phosphate alpha-N-acetylglucosaminyl 1-phosphate transferase [Pseudoalteromonas sp. SG41-6]